jgi:hypothetical protein
LGLVTTRPAVSATCHLPIGRIGPQAQRRFVNSVRQGAAEVFGKDRQPFENPLHR